jgi:hypothetical protein
MFYLNQKTYHTQNHHIQSQSGAVGEHFQVSEISHIL